MTHFTGLQFEKTNPHPSNLEVNDCVTRALVLAEGLDYRYAHRLITDAKRQANPNARTANSSVPWTIVRRVYNRFGWEWVWGHDKRFRAVDLPNQPVIVCQNGHAVFVDHYVVKDSFDSRGKRTRKILGFFIKRH